ncbi:SIMPL domain-containing protein [Arthrobacter sp. H35-D1]|uniref:SIMPL domain-containing protein n=1 Tax=Arthrobacter sp. H35-D1 TaxID=3046202 RepID=UPI0024BAACA4|nr:SIMPL domain-containing protein [Arthrobacter sp. H35-D1]MDJ0313759.1 SIMPL domain-containing protein [Arthrobacter sp. H35-D1]
MIHSENTTSNTVTVTGRGTVQAVPDYFNINIGIEAARPTVREAYASASAAMNAVNATLVAQGIARDVISSSSLDVRVDTRWQEGSGSVVTGYTVSSTLSVALRYDQGAEDVVAAVVDTGSDSVRLNGMSPVVSDPSAAQDAARAVAWADARRAAELYAQLAGRSLGAVAHVVEGAGHDDGMPRPMMARAAMSTDSAMAIEPGQSNVSLAVTTTWFLE